MPPLHRAGLSRRAFLSAVGLVMACPMQAALAGSGSQETGGDKKGTMVTARHNQPDEWQDPETGRHVRCVAPSLRASGLYHHQRAFTSDGRWMLFRVMEKSATNIHILDLHSGATRRLTDDGRTQLYVTVPGKPEALVKIDGAYHLLSVPDGHRRRVAELPPDQTFATAPDITCDGRFIVGACIEMTDEARKIDRSDRLWVLKVWRLHLKNRLFAINLETGAHQEFYHLWTWVDHLQCSPTDPTLFTYVDQGLMQRTGNGIHVLRTDGTGRERVAEGGGHHIWSADGDAIFYNDEFDHAAPWEYWRWDRRTGQRGRVLPREEWNYHFSPSPDGRSLVGDGTADNPYVNLYALGEGGGYRKERLCRRVTTNPRSEDQARFAPDGKSVFFNGDRDGVPHIFQVTL